MSSIIIPDHISEYNRRLSRDYGLNVPRLPSTIIGDTVQKIADKDAEGNVISSHKEFNFESVVSGGVALDWQNLTLRTGYFQSFFESNTYTLKEFIAAKQAETVKSESGKNSESATTISPQNWTFAETNEKIDISDADMKAIVDEINVYNGYLTKYLTAKKELQTKLYISLLQLEYTTNTYMASANVLTDVTKDGKLIPALEVW